MADKKKKKKSEKPEVPQAQAVPTLSEPSEPAAPQYEAMTLEDFKNWVNAGYDVQLARAPEVLKTQTDAQKALYEQGQLLSRQEGYQNALAEHYLLEGYAPEFRQAYSQQFQDLGLMGTAAKEGLAAGYDLGPGLSREIEQSIRGAQTARGNILGAAPTAQEAFGKGQASIDLYNQRYSQYGDYLGAQQSYLQGQNPISMMGIAGAGAGIGSTYYPSQSYVDSSLGASGMSTVASQQSDYNSTVMSGYSSYQSALQSYNSNLISGTSVTNEGLFDTYDRSAESWMYDEAVRQGLYSTPSTTSSSSSGLGSMLGTAGSAVGSAAMGLAASGVIGAGATAAGVGAAGAAAAAVSAAGAAICWLARKCIPDRWESFQHYLFTGAPEKLRRFYLYNARRLASEISDDEATEISQIMYDCINLRPQS